MLMLLVFNYSYSVSKIMPETDWKIKNLKGKVKSMVKTEYEYDSKGGYLRTGLSTSRTIQQYFDKNGIEKETLSTSWISKDTEPRVDQHLKMETKLDGKGNIIEETEIRIEIINEKTREYKENGIRKKTVITYEYYE